MEENNKIIAEFMGFTFEKNIGYYDNEMLLEQIVYEQQNGNCFDELLFNKDWNWLMAVVEKIESLGGAVCIGNGNCVMIIFYLTDVMGESYSKTRELIGETKIESVYNACVEFIEWYNENKSHL